MLELCAGFWSAIVLGWVKVDLPIEILALIGLAFLLFLAGLEIDIHRVRGRFLRLALWGYALTLVWGLAVGGRSPQAAG